MLLFKIEIPGRVPVKKNTARKTRYGVYYSKAWLEWESLACRIVRQKGIEVQISDYCEARMNFYLKNHQWEPDVTNVCEGPQDVLEKCDIFTNDKLIKRVIAEKFFFDVNPRLELELHSLELEHPPLLRRVK